MGLLPDLLDAATAAVRGLVRFIWFVALADLPTALWWVLSSGQWRFPAELPITLFIGFASASVVILPWTILASLCATYGDGLRLHWHMILAAVPTFFLWLGMLTFGIFSRVSDLPELLVRPAAWMEVGDAFLQVLVGCAIAAATAVVLYALRFRFGFDELFDPC